MTLAAFAGTQNRPQDLHHRLALLQGGGVRGWVSCRGVNSGPMPRSGSVRMIFSIR
jgi:hypothetical protein